MPITPDFSYSETETLTTVHVALIGATPKNTDVFVSDVLLKINKSPSLLVLDLHAAVEENLYRLHVNVRFTDCIYKQRFHSLSGAERPDLAHNLRDELCHRPLQRGVVSQSLRSIELCDYLRANTAILRPRYMYM